MILLKPLVSSVPIASVHPYRISAGAEFEEHGGPPLLADASLCGEGIRFAAD